jgi:hypothetical protein
LHGVFRQDTARTLTGGPEEVAADQLFEGLRYLSIRGALEGVAKVFAVDLVVPQERAQARVEYAGGGREGEAPDRRLVPKLPYSRGIIGTLAARILEADDLR